MGSAAAVDVCVCARVRCFAVQEWLRQVAFFITEQAKDKHGGYVFELVSHSTEA